MCHGWACNTSVVIGLNQCHDHMMACTYMTLTVKTLTLTLYGVTYYPDMLRQLISVCITEYS